MGGAFEVVLTKFTERKEKDVQRKLKSVPCLGILEPGDKVSIRNLPPREVAEVIQRLENDVTYGVTLWCTISQPEKISNITQKHVHACQP